MKIEEASLQWNLSWRPPVFRDHLSVKTTWLCPRSSWVLTRPPPTFYGAEVVTVYRFHCGWSVEYTGFTVSVPSGWSVEYTGFTVSVPSGWSVEYTGFTVSVPGGWSVEYTGFTVSVPSGWSVEYTGFTVSVPSGWSVELLDATLERIF